MATNWETPRGIWPGSISWLSEGIGEVALDRENIAAITRRKEVYLYFLLLLIIGVEVTSLDCSEEICSGPAFAGPERY